jgi:cysteine desulfurase / selenocysteine lyase
MKKQHILVVAVAVATIIAIIWYSLYGRKKSGFSFKINSGTIMLDNAASTMCPTEIFDTMRDFSCYYSNIHRGTGMNSLLSTHCYELSKEIVKDFVGATPYNKYFVSFGKNVTEQLNLVVAIIGQLYSRHVRSRSVILLSEMEHTSNDIPFRFLTRLGMVLDYIKLNGADLDYNDLQMKVQKYGSNLNLISITGVSNVTGIKTNLPVLAKSAHSVGAWICIDGAQLVPHTRVDMTQLGLDFLGFSAHKMYCPLGLGVLVGRIEILNLLTESPLIRGGGEIIYNAILTPTSGTYPQDLNIIWKKNEDLLEGGTGAVIPCVALIKTLKGLQRIGLDNIETHESKLYALAYSLFSTLPITIVSPPPSGISTCILSFFTPVVDSALIGAILCFEYGISVRTGCLCANNYVSKLTGKTAGDIQRLIGSIKNNEKTTLPGVVRISIAMYNSEDDIKLCFVAVKNILEEKVKFNYVRKDGGGYVPDHEKDLDTCVCKQYNTLLKTIVEG